MRDRPPPTGGARDEKGKPAFAGVRDPERRRSAFEAWKALGRYVRKGEHGVKVVTFIDCKSKETAPDTGERKVIRRPWTTTVFHISQTEALKGGGK